MAALLEQRRTHVLDDEVRAVAAQTAKVQRMYDGLREAAAERGRRVRALADEYEALDPFNRKRPVSAEEEEAERARLDFLAGWHGVEGARIKMGMGAREREEADATASGDTLLAAAAKAHAQDALGRVKEARAAMDAAEAAAASEHDRAEVLRHMLTRTASEAAAVRKAVRAGEAECASLDGAYTEAKGEIERARALTAGLHKRRARLEAACARTRIELDERLEGLYEVQRMYRALAGGGSGGGGGGGGAMLAGKLDGVTKSRRARLGPSALGKIRERVASALVDDLKLASLTTKLAGLAEGFERAARALNVEPGAPEAERIRRVVEAAARPGGRYDGKVWELEARKAALQTAARRARSCKPPSRT